MVERGPVVFVENRAMVINNKTTLIKINNIKGNSLGKNGVRISEPRHRLLPGSVWGTYFLAKWWGFGQARLTGRSWPTPGVGAAHSRVAKELPCVTLCQPPCPRAAWAEGWWSTSWWAALAYRAPWMKPSLDFPIGLRPPAPTPGGR